MQQFNYKRALEGALIGALLSSLPILDPLANGQPVNYRAIILAFIATVIITIAKGFLQSVQGQVSMNVIPPPGTTTVTETTVLPTPPASKEA